MSFAANMYLYLVEGSVICATNSILLCAIICDRRNQRRREFQLVAAQAIADLCYAVAFMLIANLRLNLYFQNSLTRMVPTWQCAFIPALWLHNIATPLLGLLPMTTSFNFLICSVAPIWYMKAGKSYTVVLLSIPFLLTTLLVALNALLLIGDESPTSAVCIAANGAAHPVIYHIMLFFRIVANLASAIIYAFILIYLRRSSSKSGSDLSQLSTQQLKTHRNAKITLGLVTTNSMLLLFGPDILLFANPFDITKKFSTPLYSMTLSKTMINFIIYMWRYRELRNIILLRIFACCPSRLREDLGRYLVTNTDRGQSCAPKSGFVTKSAYGDTVSQARRSSRKGSSVAPVTLSRPPRRLPPLQKPTNADNQQQTTS